jgi:predicted enzyme related to lactoylglutathione lyase
MSNLRMVGRGTAALAVKDLNSSVAWYQEILGCEVARQPEGMGWCEMTSPIPGFYLGLQEVSEFKGDVGGATLMFEVEDVSSTRKELEARAVRFEGDTFTIPNVVSMATFFDPSGNALKIFQPLAGHQPRGGNR